MIDIIFALSLMNWYRFSQKKAYLCGVNERRDIIISDTLTGIGRGEVAGYLCHAYCHTGFCEFTYNIVSST